MLNNKFLIEINALYNNCKNHIADWRLAHLNKNADETITDTHVNWMFELLKSLDSVSSINELPMLKEYASKIFHSYHNSIKGNGPVLTNFEIYGKLFSCTISEKMTHHVV